MGMACVIGAVLMPGIVLGFNSKLLLALLTAELIRLPLVLLAELTVVTDSHAAHRIVQAPMLLLTMMGMVVIARRGVHGLMPFLVLGGFCCIPVMCMSPMVVSEQMH